MQYGLQLLDVAGLNKYLTPPQGLGAFGQGLGSMQGASTTVMDVAGITPGLGDVTTKASSAGGASNAMSNVSIGLAIGQAIGSVYSAWKGGKTTDYIYKKQAEIAEHNRQRGQLAAESVYRQAEGQIAQITYKAGQVKAGQRAAFGANGVAVGSGSSAEVLASTDIMKEIDVANTRMSALSAAWGYKNQALQAGGQAAQFSAMGGYQKDAAMGSAFGSLLEGGFEVADRWYRYRGVM